MRLDLQNPRECLPNLGMRRRTPQGSAVTWSQLPEQHRFAMITTLFTNSIFGWLPMKRYFLAFLAVFSTDCSPRQARLATNVFQSLAFYSTKVEPDHVLFAEVR